METLDDFAKQDPSDLIRYDQQQQQQHDKGMAAQGLPPRKLS